MFKTLNQAHFQVPSLLNVWSILPRFLLFSVSHCFQFCLLLRVFHFNQAFCFYDSVLASVYVNCKVLSFVERHLISAFMMMKMMSVHIGENTGQNFRKYRTFTGQIIDNGRA